MRRKNIKYNAGDKYGMLTFIEFSRYTGSTKYWVVECECGVRKSLPAYDVYSGHTKCCGCNTFNYRSKSRMSHGMTETREYRMWCHMRARCNCITNKKYRVYPL